MFCLLLMSSLLFFSVGFSETLEQRAAKDVLVKFKFVPQSLDNVEFSFAEKIRSIKQALPIGNRRSELAKIATITSRTASDASEILDLLRVDPRVEWAELRPIRHNDARLNERMNRGHLDAPPNDPYYSQQWWLDQIEAPSAWDIVAPDSSVLLAVVDDGVYFGLSELSSSRWDNYAEVDGASGVDDDVNGFVDDLYGYDFIQFDGDPTPDPLDGYNSHGTHVAGIAAAARNNWIGIAGVAGGAKVMGVRVGQGGSIPYGFEGVFYACQNGARVINCSWGGATESAYEREIVNYVRAQGCVIVCSAGNNGSSIPRYPAAIEGVLSVAATTAANTGAGFTNYGPWVKISAPGVHILSTVVDGTYGAWQGTSMAAPIVTAVCALMQKKYPAWTGDQIVTAICNSADPIDSLNDTLAGGLGLGRVNAYRAVSNAEVPHGVRLASLRFHETVGDGDNRVEAAEQAFLDVEIVNDLSELEGVTGYVYSQLDSITVVPNELTYPLNMGNGFWWSDFSDPRIRMPAVIDRGAVLPLRLEWRDAQNRVVGRATTTVLLDSTIAVIETDALKFALGEQGALGYFDYIRSIPVGPGLALKNELSNALYHGSVFVGVDGKVIDNYYGDSLGTRFDWRALPGVYARTVESNSAPVAVNSRFDDRMLPELERVGVEVSATMLSWPEIENGLVIELTIINRGQNQWQSAHCGLMMDWDLGPASRNFGVHMAGNGILYVHSELQTLPMVGIAGLEEDISTAYEIGNRDEFQQGGLSAARAWQLVTAGIGGFTAEPRDLSHIAGLTLPSMLAGDSVRKYLAILVGDSPSELQRVLTDLREELGVQRGFQSKETLPSTNKQPVITPNPLSQGQTLSIAGIGSGMVQLTFFNILGQEIVRFSERVDATGMLEIPVLPSLAPGLMLYRLEHSGGQSTGKLLYLP